MGNKTKQEIPKTQACRLFAGDGWIISVAEYSQRSLPQYESISGMLNEKRHTVKNSGATYRVINHWADVGLIEDDSRRSDEGWRRLSFIDLVWIQVLVELRKFGMPLELLRLARGAIFDVPDRPDRTKPEFEYAVAHCLMQDPRQFLLLCFADGWAEVADQALFDINSEVGSLAGSSYLVVDLNSCCQRVIPKAPIPKHIVKLMLSDEELAVIESLRSGKFDVVEVHSRQGKIERIKRKSTKSIGAEKLDQLARSIEFGEFTVKVQKGKAVLTEITESKKA